VDNYLNCFFDIVFLIFLFPFLFVAGSTGDPNAPQLIVGNRGVQLQYAKEQEKKHENFNSAFNDKDWSCEAVSLLVFLLRTLLIFCDVPLFT
jgi:hypothetical protein